jgi:hypothetical protein
MRDAAQGGSDGRLANGSFGAVGRRLLALTIRNSSLAKTSSDGGEALDGGCAAAAGGDVGAACARTAGS